MIKKFGKTLAILTVLSMTSNCWGQDIEAIVNGGQVRIRKNPSAASSDVAYTVKGEKLTIIDENFNGSLKLRWVKVKTAKSVVGFIFSRYLTLQKDAPLINVPSSNSVKPANVPPVQVEGTQQQNLKTISGLSGNQAKRTVEILDKNSIEGKINKDINQLTESLAKDGKSADIRSVVVFYSAQDTDTEKLELKNMIKQLQATVAEQGLELDIKLREISSLKDQLRSGNSRIESELTVLRGELNNKVLVVGETSGTKDIEAIKNIVSNIQQQISLMMKTSSLGKEKRTETPGDYEKLKRIVSVITKMPDFELISRVESSGEEVHLKGVGSVKMFIEGNLVIFKVGKSASKNGEKVFSHLLKRIINGGDFIYFICDKDMVQGAEMLPALGKS